MVAAISPLQEKLLTGEELSRIPNADLCELIDGRIVPMSPTNDEHGGIELNFGEALNAVVRRNRLGRVRVGEVGIYTRRNPDRVRAADVLYISNERYAQKQSESYLDVAPDLVVEILSPRDTASDMTQKLREYFAIGVRLVWVADPDTRTVLAYRSLTDVREFKGSDTLPGDDVLPDFATSVAELFEV